MKVSGVPLLLSDGRSIGGFRADEADRYLIPLGGTGLDYKFENVGRLAAGCRRGVFAEAFHHARVLRIAHESTTPQLLPH